MPSTSFLQSHRILPPGSQHIGDVDPELAITVSIYLKPRSNPQAALPASREELHSKRALQHKEDIELVSKFATDAGLTVESVHPGRRLIKLRGKIGQFQRAFNVSLANYQHGDKKFRGRTGSLTLPEELLGIIESVNGLDDREAAQPNFVDLNATMRGYLPNEVGKFYDFPTTVTGKEQCIAIIELGGGYYDEDVRNAFAAMRLPFPTIVPVLVDGGANAPANNSASQEVALDIQVAGGSAPGATLAVYFAPNSPQGFLDSISQAIHDTDNRPGIVSISWGSTETVWTRQGRDSMDSIFQDAINLGVSVFVASGDYLATNGVNDGYAHVQYPASSPYAIGCGGTLISSSQNGVDEVVWNDGTTGTGGGISALYGVPPFQQSAQLPVGVNNHQLGRGVPDIAGNASPNSGYTIAFNGGTITLGGTSAVAPLWAGLTALINEGLGRTIGFFLPTIYQTPQLMRQITKGNNRLNGLGYDATPGWNACTGTGVPIGSALFAYFTSKVPKTGAIVAAQVLQKNISADRAERLRKHQASVASFVRSAVSPTPLCLLAQGDSWFNYPLNGNWPTGIDTDVIAQLTASGSPCPKIYNLAVAGETSVNELGLKKQGLIIDALTDPKNWLNGRPDAILFSAGGNDIVGDGFCIFLNFADPGASGLDKSRLDEALGMIEASYQSLFLIRDRYAPGVPIFGHCYDFPIPNGEHPPCVGPWLQPSLHYYGWDNIVEGTAIVHQALIEFKARLQSLAQEPENNFILIDSQGTLTPSDWANELHPYPSGFKKIANLFTAALQKQFSGRM